MKIGQPLKAKPPARAAWDADYASIYAALANVEGGGVLPVTFGTYDEAFKFYRRAYAMFRGQGVRVQMNRTTLYFSTNGGEE